MNHNCDNVRHRLEQYCDFIFRLYPELHEGDKDQVGRNRVITRQLTFQVTDGCNLCCSYCYQTNKGKRKMSFETAKKMIDMLFDNDEKLDGYITLENSPGINIDFIGGEPFLEIELIEQICDYFLDEAIRRKHPWALRHKFTITSNGVLYFDEKVQHFLNKYSRHLALSVTLDGNKELHDSCRVFPDGRPSYDYALAACEDWMSKGNYMGSKITIAPGNITHLFSALKHMVELGYDDINANTVYEEGWNVEHAKIFYEQLKLIADYLIDNNVEDKIYCSLFEDHFFCPMDETDLNNWCGGTGAMLAVDPDGYLYPCIRYMESSIGSEVEPYRIGHVDTGIAKTDQEIKRMQCLDCITRKSQSTQECFECPIARGCGWCSAYNYQMNGTPDSRCTFNCIMHKARSLGNVYFWNKFYKKHDVNMRMPVFCPPEWALEIIDENEYNSLLESTMD